MRATDPAIPDAFGLMAEACLRSNVACADHPHLALANLGFTEADIIAFGPTLLAHTAQTAQRAQDMACDAATAIAGLPLTDPGLIISHLRTRGFPIATIALLYSDIIGEAMRQQRLVRKAA